VIEGLLAQELRDRSMVERISRSRRYLTVGRYLSFRHGTDDAAKGGIALLICAQSIFEDTSLEILRNGRAMHAGSVGSSLAVVVDGLRFFAAMPCICPASYDDEADEERDGRNGEDGDGSTEAGTDLRSGAGGSVAAHAAALRTGHECGREQHDRHEANAEKMDLSEAEAHMRAY
jgi:hypothetical protein